MKKSESMDSANPIIYVIKPALSEGCRNHTALSRQS